MSETLLGAIIGVAGTILGGLGVAYLTKKSTDAQIRTQRRHEIQDIARAAILDALVAGRTWINTVRGPSLIIGSRDTLDEVDDYVKSEIANPVTFNAITEHGDAFARAATNAKLLIADPEISAVLSELLRLANAWAVTAIDKPRADLRAGQTDKVERLRHWHQFEADFRFCIDELERLATKAMSAPVTDS